jgi:predicted secreted hydrolase
VRKVRKRAILFGVAAVAALGTAGVVAVSPGAHAGTTAGTTVAAQSRTAAGAVAPSTSPAYPTFVKLPEDQAAHPKTSNEWWYVVGRVKAHGHVFGYEVQIVSHNNIDNPNGPLTPPEVFLAISDVTTGKYYTKSFLYSPSQGKFSATTLDESTPNASLSGPLNDMHLRATLPEGTIDLTLDAKGPVLYNNGTGLIPFLTGSSYYYSLPTLATTGTLTELGKSYKVSGLSWLDHQYGDWTWTNLGKWTWMGVHLSNGVSLGLADIFNVGSPETSSAAVLDPDGTEEFVAVNPLAPGTSGFVTSPTTGQTYGTKWHVEIPALHASLTVTASPALQEIQAGPGIYEGVATITGTYEGKPVTGQAQAEQLGDWHKA